MDTVDIKIANSRFRRKCQDKLTRSVLPPELKATLHAILSYIGSASHYTICWASTETIAKHCGIKRRAVQKHMLILQHCKLISREIHAAPEAKRILKEEFGYNLKVGE